MKAQIEALGDQIKQQKALFDTNLSRAQEENFQLRVELEAQRFFNDKLLEIIGKALEK